MSTLQGKSISSIGAIVGIASIVSNLAVAQSQTLPPATIADNDSIYIDGKTFAITPGRAKGDTSAQIEALGARDLGPGAIIFRSGEKLYIVAAPVLVPGARNQAGQNVPAPVENDRPNRVTVEYVVPKSAELQELYGMLREHRVLEDMQGILSPFRLPEELTIKTTECGMVNSWYGRENSKPTVTICYELLRHILQSLPKKTAPGAITPKDAAVGQFFWLTTHEVGHAMFDLFKVPIFGHAEDAADNFAGYIMLQFGKERARRLIAGGAWAWRMYVADYRTNPIVQTQLAGFASNHGQPEERFYNLMCLAFGADPVTFADLTQDGYLPPNRSPSCRFEYDTLAYAFHREISPHIDQQMARQVLDTAWFSNVPPTLAPPPPRPR
jgi:Putative metallopeptidase